MPHCQESLYPASSNRYPVSAIQYRKASSKASAQLQNLQYSFEYICTHLIGLRGFEGDPDKAVRKAVKIGAIPDQDLVLRHQFEKPGCLYVSVQFEPVQ